MTRPDRRRPPVRLSSLPPFRFDLDRDGRCVMICCPVCGRHRSVTRSLIEAHRRPGRARLAEDGIGWLLPGWCKGSGRRLVCDVSYAKWIAQRQQGRRARLNQSYERQGMIHSSVVVTQAMTQPQIRDLFDHARQAVAALAGPRPRARSTDLRWRHGDSTYWLPGNYEFEVLRGQGIPVHVRVVYSQDGPLRAHPDSDGPAGTVVEVALDSSGFDTHPHLPLIQAITAWLTKHQLNFQWRCEDRLWRSGIPR